MSSKAYTPDPRWVSFREQWKKDFAEMINARADILFVQENDMIIHSFKTGAITSRHMIAALMDTGWTEKKIGPEWCYFRPGVNPEDLP